MIRRRKSACARRLTRFPQVSDPSPTIRAALDHIVDAWHADAVTHAGVLLVARRHVDLLRVASALCVPVR
ncbi:putative leader peptide [Amycolatopsis sp. NPDC049688]|uniref:putative leader peptide n=1 Tax=Amycolatopsis sp. NPDC049688 TaxID=3154733 RepID=UPI003423A049